MEVSIAPLRGLCKVFIGGWRRKLWGLLGLSGGTGHPLALQLPSPAMDIFGKCCVPLGEIWLLSRNAGGQQHSGDVFVCDHK